MNGVVEREEKTTQVILNRDQKEAVDEVADFLSTLDNDGVKSFKAFVQGVRFSSSLMPRATR